MSFIRILDIIISHPFAISVTVLAVLPPEKTTPLTLILSFARAFSI